MNDESTPRRATKKGQANVKNERLELRLTKQQKQQIQGEAMKRGMSAAAYVLSCVFPETEEDRAIESEILAAQVAHESPAAKQQVMSKPVAKKPAEPAKVKQVARTQQAKAPAVKQQDKPKPVAATRPHPDMKQQKKQVKPVEKQAEPATQDDWEAKFLVTSGQVKDLDEAKKKLAAKAAKRQGKKAHENEEAWVNSFLGEV